MKPLVEPIVNDPNQSFKLGVYNGEPGCMEDYWHIHPEYEIVYVHNGSGRRHIGTHISSYEDGVLLMLGPNIPHLPLGNQINADNFEVVVQFSEEFLSQRMGAFPEFELVQDLKRRAGSGLSFGTKTRSRLGSFIKPHGQLEPQDRLMWFLRLLIELSKAEDVVSLDAYGVRTDKGQVDYQRIRTIFNYITNHFDEELTLDIIADQVGLTRNSLCRFFKKLTGQTIIDYLNEYRVGMAKEYLLEGKLNVSEILYKCGFNDPSFFYKKFRSQTGLSPRAYQKQFIFQNPRHQRSDHIHPPHLQEEAHLHDLVGHSEAL
ncbi:MAG: AraC family transcriptional regulator [Marinoscillum sp.]